jgi:hypothetical protein
MTSADGRRLCVRARLDRPGVHRFGPDDLANLITLCDLCHAVVTPRWHKPYCPDGMQANRADIESMRAEYEEFLRLPPEARRERQELLWPALGVS